MSVQIRKKAPLDLASVPPTWPYMPMCSETSNVQPCKTVRVVS
jgi:hypothetical protein